VSLLNHCHDKILTKLAAHKYLCEKLKVLHCDISVGNILLYRPDDNSEATGLLIDFDFAATIEDIATGILTSYSINNEECEAIIDGGLLDNEAATTDVADDDTDATSKKPKNRVWTVSCLTIQFS
jgi:Fungal protein kinase